MSLMYVRKLADGLKQVKSTEEGHQDKAEDTVIAPSPPPRRSARIARITKSKIEPSNKIRT